MVVVVIVVVAVMMMMMERHGAGATYGVWAQVSERMI